MKRVLILFLALILIGAQFCFPVSAETYVPTRVINLVYDNSGSMITDGNAYFDTWCQAKYAMEVFAAMLGEKDTLNIFYMSDFDYYGQDSREAGMTLSGSLDAAKTAANVEKIHNFIPEAGNTPFNAVQEAQTHLVRQTADEKWLVVLTDGVFNDDDKNILDKTVSQEIAIRKVFDKWVAENDNENIMMLSMGSKATKIAEDGVRIFSGEAKTSSAILGELTKMCSRIFQNNALELDGQNAEFNVPMSQLIIFAQGKEVSINGIKDASGNSMTPDSNVKVQYSTQATTDKDIADLGYDRSKIVTDEDLLGYVATFNAAFEPGKYKLDVTGAETIEVYYKPNIEIKVQLRNADGRNMDDAGTTKIPAGDYTIDFSFVSGTDGTIIEDTSLLGDVNFKATVRKTDANGQETVDEDVSSGQTIKVENGHLEVEVVGTYLKYNTVTCRCEFDVNISKALEFKFESTPTYELTKDGFKNPDDPLVLTVKCDNGDGRGYVELTAEQWEKLGIPEISTKAKLDAFKVERTDEIGKYLVYPMLKDNDPLETATGTIKIFGSGQFEDGDILAYGAVEGTFEIKNGISFADRVRDFLEKYWKQLTISLLLLILILGYIPPFKRYLPRRVKKIPLITCSAQKVGLRDMEAHGLFKKNLVSTLIPYKAQTGWLRFAPAPHQKTVRLKATKGQGMFVTNAREFAGKPEFTFNGMPIEEGKTKPFRIGTTHALSRSTADYTYTCYPNR